MKKSFFSWHTDSFLYVLTIFSAITNIPLDAMGKKYIHRILTKVHKPIQLSPTQLRYIDQGKASFLYDLSKGSLTSTAAVDAARLFTHMPRTKTERIVRGFSDRVDNMNEIRKRMEPEENYTSSLQKITDEFEQESLGLACCAIDDMEQELLEIVLCSVPNVLNRSFHYFGVMSGERHSRGTLLDYVEDKKNLASGHSDELCFVLIEKELLRHGAKTLDELEREERTELLRYAPKKGGHI